MLKYLTLYSDWFGPLRVFDSITFRSALAVTIAYLFTVLAGGTFIRALRHFRVREDVNKPDSAHLHQLHSAKRNTPTMGGIIMVMAILIACVLCADPRSPYVILAIFTLLSFSGLGMIDDIVKLRRLGGRMGLTARQKLVAQTVLAFICGSALVRMGDPEHVTHMLIPAIKMSTWYPDLAWLYLPFFMLVLVGSCNAVNLTDGLDGLAAGCSLLVALCFTALTYIAGHAVFAEYLRVPSVAHCGELTVFVSAMAGATLGFLWYNANPARVFMGDTGSLALGASIGFVAMAVKQEFVLLIAGGIFVSEALSVIMQRLSFRFRGKRVFRCAPVHHHFQFAGWKENHIVVRFWCIGIVLATLGLATLKLH